MQVSVVRNNIFNFSKSEGKKMKTQSGFTLVEILIVVVILGILAAIVIPQFTSASTEAKEAALVSDLQAMRSQIELYKIHHNDQLPGTQATNDFTTAMTSKTNQDGEDTTQATDPLTCRYGPYMRKIPINPFTNDLFNVSEGAARLTVGIADTAWHFVNAGTGEDLGLFQAADVGVDPLDDTHLHVDY
jgi:general secretion pathway protein G